MSKMFGVNNGTPNNPGMFGGRAPQQNPMANILNQFNEFKKQFGDQDPKKMVEELLQSGKMSQEQFEQLKQIADTFAPMLK